MRKPIKNFSQGLLITALVLLWTDFTRAGPLTKEEQALVKKGAVMEMYKPDEHSRHFIGHIDSVTDPNAGEPRKTSKKSQPVVCFVFGIEDSRVAQEEGRSMAESNYTSSQVHEFLFVEGWDKYHDRFFTRCYVQEGEEAYDQAVKAQQKPVDQSSSS